MTLELIRETGPVFRRLEQVLESTEFVKSSISA